MPRPDGKKPLTLADAKLLRRGTILNVYDLHGRDFIRNADGTPARYKVTSVKVWKRQPDKVEVVVQWGLKSFFHLKEHMFQPVETVGDGQGVVYKQDA